MQFREWLSKDELTLFFDKIKSHVIRFIHVEEDNISLSFPKSYEILLQPSFQQPMALAAGTIPLGTSITEATARNKIDRGMSKLSGTWFPQSLSNPNKFKTKFSQNTRNIAKNMGMLFETEVFLYFVAKRFIIRGDKTLQWAESNKQIQLTEISRKTGQEFTSDVSNFVKFHAEDLGGTILIKAKSLIHKCKIDTVEFAGGNLRNMVNYRHTADIVIGCSSCDTCTKSSHSQINYSLKLASESLVRMADMSCQQVYRMLGGENIERFQNNFSQFLPEDIQERVQFVLDELEPLVKKIVKEKPLEKLNYIVNKLISGTKPDNRGIGDVLPAVKNWVLNKATPSFSAGFKQFFDTNESDKEAKAYLKSDSKASYRRTGSRLSMYISNPSTNNMFKIEIQVENTDNNVVFKINNMV